MKKKILVVISSVLIFCSLVACGSKNDKEQKDDLGNQTQNQETSKKDDIVLNDKGEEDKEDKEEDKEDKEDTDTTQADKPVDVDTNKVDKESTATPEKTSTENQDKTTVPQPPISEGSNNTSQSTGTTEKEFRIFYYDFPSEKMVYLDKKVKVTDGAVVNALTKELKNNNNNDGFLILDSETAVTSAKLDRDNDVLKVYFNESLNKSMGLGTNSQCELVNSIVYTYGYNYGVSNVAIYVNGEPFVDPRGSLPKGYYTVDISGVTEFK